MTENNHVKTEELFSMERLRWLSEKQQIVDTIIDQHHVSNEYRDDLRITILTEAHNELNSLKDYEITPDWLSDLAEGITNQQINGDVAV